MIRVLCVRVSQLPHTLRNQVALKKSQSVKKRCVACRELVWVSAAYRRHIAAGTHAPVECPMTDLDAMLASVRESPFDDTPRLIFADWIEERSWAVKPWTGLSVSGAEIAEWIRAQVALHRTNPIKWKAGTILGRRRLEGPTDHRTAPFGPSLAVVANLPRIDTGKEHWGPLEPYTPDVHVVAMSVLKKDLPDPGHAALRKQVQARRDICNALSPKRWPPIKVIHADDMTPFIRGEPWPRGITQVLLPGEPIRVLEVVAGETEKSQPVPLVRYVASSHDEDVAEVLIVEADSGKPVHSVMLQRRGGTVEFVFPAGFEPDATGYDVSASAPATVTMQFGVWSTD